MTSSEVAFEHDIFYHMCDVPPNMTITRELRDSCTRELRFYQQYHTNAANWWLHAMAVPVEWTCWLVAVALLGGHLALPWLPWLVQGAVAIVVRLTDGRQSRARATPAPGP